MKYKLLLLLLLSANVALAQLAILPGATFTVNGNILLTLQNTDFINNGNFKAGNGMASFTGNFSSSIAGSEPIQFFDLEMRKSNNSSVVLQKAIGITKRILFTSGFLNLNGFNADLGTTARLDGENENSRITAINGGEVLFSTVLNTPSGANPGNLGAIITSMQNLGNVLIKRGHQSQSSAPGMDSSIHRYYDIQPANNTNLNATLRFNYFNAELNGVDENDLRLFNNVDNTNWTNLGFTSKDGTANFVEKTGISSLSRFTLSVGKNPATVNCTNDVSTVWPNPVHEKVFINIVSCNKSQLEMKVFDSKGALVKIRSETVLQGNSQVSVNTGSLTNGTYELSLYWNNGKTRKTIQLIKQ